VSGATRVFYVKRAGLFFFATVLVAAHGWANGPKKAAPKKVTGPKYAHYVKSWHTPVPNKPPPADASGRPMLALVSLNTSDRLEMSATSPLGGFGATQLDRAAYVLREAHSDNEHPIEPRLLDVVYQIQTHFAAQEVRIVSAYRTPHRSTSNHGRGRAIDLVVPGVSDEDVAKFARELGFVGVGVYPTSGFVHIDVRERSYFWVDASGPGARNRERGILGDLAKKSDAQALARGDKPVAPFLVALDVDAAIRAHASASPASATEEDEDID